MTKSAEEALADHNIRMGFGCTCHGKTFCPDLTFVGYDNDVPIFQRKDKPMFEPASSPVNALLLASAERGFSRERAQTMCDHLAKVGFTLIPTPDNPAFEGMLHRVSLAVDKDLRRRDYYVSPLGADAIARAVLLAILEPKTPA